jgi:LPXTG-motif cell wall-anchored protein
VYAALAVLLVLPAAVLLIAGLFRALTELYQGETWASWLTLGGIFVLVGGFLWIKRNA